MKYTLQENAMSSFHLAIENFKIFFYNSESYKQSELDEARKLCAIFLENSIELFLKALLVKIDPISIYEHPESKLIKRAKEEADKRNKDLEDILVEQGNFKTISYTQTVEKYNSIHKSERTKNIFLRLAEYRNQLTHFGIIDDDNEFTIACLNVFSVVYQNLYEELVKLEKIEQYFTDEDIYVRTIHGVKKLYDENYVYNNVIDFLDELVVETAPYISLSYRLNNPEFKLKVWYQLFDETIKSPNFQKMLDFYEVKIDWSFLFEYEISFEIHGTFGLWDSIISTYCPYYNATTFIGETGLIYFRVLHSSNEIIIYFDDVTLPELDMPQYEEEDWNEQLFYEDAKKKSLTKRNIKLAFETICKEIKKYKEECDNNNLQSTEEVSAKAEYDAWVKEVTENYINSLSDDSD